MFFFFQNNIKVESADILKQVPQCPAPFLVSPSTPTSGPAVLQQTPGSEQNMPPAPQPSHTNQPPTQEMREPATVSVSQQPPQPYLTHSNVTGTSPVSGNISGSFPQPQMSAPFGQNVMAPSSTGPAMLPVTQLPSGGVAHMGSSNVVVVDDDDDFADFQAASPSAANIAPNTQPVQTPSHQRYKTCT